MPITGAPTCIARSMILQIFSACASDSEPPNTVKSWLNTNTSRPLIVPWPVTTPSPGISLLGHAEIAAAMLDEHVGLFERVRVEQELDALAGGKLAALVLRLDPPLATAQPGRRALGIELLEDLLHRAFSTPPDRGGQVAWPLRRRKPAAARQLSFGRPALSASAASQALP